jgi:hypothetical protein
LPRLICEKSSKELIKKSTKNRHGGRCNLRPPNRGENNMKRIALAVVLSAFALSPVLSPALAQDAGDSCSTKAVSSEGKPLAGAALKSFMTKCKKDACEPKAVDKNGKALAGAAKTSFMKKCAASA